MKSWAGSGPRAEHAIGCGPLARGGTRAVRGGEGSAPRARCGGEGCAPRAPQDRRSARRTLQKEGLACQWFTTIAHERGEIGLWLTGILTNHAIACAQLLLP